jgi:hypothetical protein
MKNLLRYKDPLLLFAILAAFAWYAAGYIQASSFIAGGQRYYVLFDDAMVSMRYAWNLAHGHGAVWNAGEYVEGYTNPLWMLYMTFWHLLPMAASQISLAIQVTGAVLLGFNLIFLYKIVRHLTNDTLALFAALTLTAFYGPLDVWGLLGMEVSLLALILTAAVWIVLTRDLSRWIPWLYLLLGLGTLVRVDLAVPFVLLIGFEALTDRPRRRQHLLWGLGMLVGFLGAQELVRLWYYGDLLPNTYYLKMTNFSTVIRIARGFWVLFELAWQSNWVVLLLPLAVFVFRRDKDVTLLALLFAGQVAYSTYVGGDAWEHKGGANRFVSTALPLWFALWGVTLASLRKTVETELKLTAGWSRAAANLIALVLVGFSLWNLNFLLADYKSIDRWLLERKPVYIEANEKYVNTALALGKFTLPGAKIAVTAAGTEPYFLPDRYFIDLLGKADKVIAHEPIKAPVSLAGIADVRPGHMKWDYAYSLGKLKPDVIVQLWEGDFKTAEPYLKEYVEIKFDGLPFFVRKGSPLILWDVVK